MTKTRRVHSKTPHKISDSGQPKKKKLEKNPDKIYIVIQHRGETDLNTMKVRFSSETSIGEIRAFLEDKFGDQSKYLYLTSLKPKKSKNKKQHISQSLYSLQQEKEKVDIVFKTSVGSESEEARLKIPRNIKIQVLKDALARKFGLSSTDFQLVHVDQD